ncbi:uncharacterized protein LOC128221612 [Mya arenaria]|uniref:uncharacterized protein LOC128221612 n=1 Tax=Mya arenaria TaxID=6604 RepID=UPI0022E44CFC|nr:uncharacterized protein LOC128221612 [Mya arenaria]
MASVYFFDETELKGSRHCCEHDDHFFKYHGLEIKSRNWHFGLSSKQAWLCAVQVCCIGDGLVYLMKTEQLCTLNSFPNSSSRGWILNGSGINMTRSENTAD